MADLENVKKDFVDLFDQAQNLLKDNSTEFIYNKRIEAFENFKNLGIPRKHYNEEYKYLDFGPAFDHNYGVTLVKEEQKEDLEKMFECDVPELNNNMVITVNGHFHKNAQLNNIPEGVIVCSFLEASINYPDLIKKYYGTSADNTSDGLVALNTTFAVDGVFVYVPKNAIIEDPIQIIGILNKDIDYMSHVRNLVVLEDNAQANIVFCDHALTSKRFLTTSVTEVFVGENANLDFCNIQNQHNFTHQINSVFYKQNQNSVLTTNTVTLHGGLIRNNINVLMDGKGCESNVYGLYLVDKNQKVDNSITVDHKYSDCLSNQLFKGVMDDTSLANFSGKIIVRKDSQRTEAYQTNKNILLTDDAKVNTKPQLIIDADDVKCSHGATVGQIDEDALFYLKARGIGDDEARMLLMHAFTDDVVGKIKFEPLRDKISNLIESRLRGELSKCHHCAVGCEKK